MITLKRATPEAVRYACMNFHYAKAIPPALYAYNVYIPGGVWCGVIIYGNGGNSHIGAPFGMKHGEVLELVRVALNGNQPCTSECVAASIRQVHKDAPQCKLIVSYADIDQAHVGTIYQATNWIYLGETNVGAKNSGFIVNGKRLHPATLKVRGWKQNEEWLRKYIDPKARALTTKGKRKYIWVFDKKLRKEWQKKALPYPKKPCVSSSTEEQPAILREGGGSTPTLTLQ